MARSDQERWDKRYAEGDWTDAEEPSQIVEDSLPWLAPPGLVLDVACGIGRNSIFLANYGFVVVAVDISWRGLHKLAKRARRERLPIYPVHADLEHFYLPDNGFDVIVNTKFLQRSLLPEYERALKPGGLLVFETYNVDEIDVLGGDIRREYTLERGELREALPGLDMLLYEEGVFELPEGERGLARMVARRMED